MNILALDTSSSMLSVSLTGSEGSASFSLDIGTKHTERLMETIDFCLKHSGLARADIGLIACALGPGSFTGLRIGMSTAKGLSLALGKPWVAVPTLDCHAFGLEVFPGAVVPVIDGKKGRVYAAIYERGLRTGDWLDICAGDLSGKVDGYDEVLFCGPDAGLFEETCLERPGFRVLRLPGINPAPAMAALAARILEKDGPARDDTGPLYLRLPEAEESIRR